MGALASWAQTYTQPSGKHALLKPPQGALEKTTELHSTTVWNGELVEEWAAVLKRDPNISCGRVFSVLGEKNAERHAPVGEREYKFRIVRG